LIFTEAIAVYLKVVHYFSVRLQGLGKITKKELDRIASIPAEFRIRYLSDTGSEHSVTPSSFGINIVNE
jgi:hypothetical protein